MTTATAAAMTMMMMSGGEMAKVGFGLEFGTGGSAIAAASHIDQ